MNNSFSTVVAGIFGVEIFEHLYEYIYFVSPSLFVPVMLAIPYKSILPPWKLPARKWHPLHPVPTWEQPQPTLKQTHTKNICHINAYVYVRVMYVRHAHTCNTTIHRPQLSVAHDGLERARILVCWGLIIMNAEQDLHGSVAVFKFDSITFV